MESFEEWAKSTTQHSCVKEHADRLVELGATWDSFLARNAVDIAKDLICGGIPPLSAHTVVDVAVKAAKKREAPMAIFWDIENMPIPTTSSGRDVSSRLKSMLKPYGNLVQFRGYASIGLNHIPQQKRSDLQLSGCLLVDCPHVGRKEVADKMIIVDAMNFAMQNPEGATLCFITGDIDFSYLLAVLQRYKQYRTIVISKGTLQSMLDINCDMKMRWETDVLQLRSTMAWKNTAKDLHLTTTDTDSAPALSTASDEDEASENPFEMLTEDEEWIDDAEFLRNLVRSQSTTAYGGAVLKSLVGGLLRQTNPARFPHREAVQGFLARAISVGVVKEIGEGATKQLHLPCDESTGMFPAISIATQLPVSISFVPDKVKEVAQQGGRPYIILIKWKFCPSGTRHPQEAFVHQKDAWGFFLFAKLAKAQRTVSEQPWLRNGILVDWRNIKASPVLLLTSSVSSTGNYESLHADACFLCRSVRSDIELVPYKSTGADDRLCCPECKEWERATTEERMDAAKKVGNLLEEMAANDDIGVNEGILKKQVSLRSDYGCESRKYAQLWIKTAVDLGVVKAIPRDKNKEVCLPSRFEEATAPYPPDALNTTKEIEAVVDYLWDTIGWVDRKSVITELKQKFPQSMSHPYYRAKVLLDGQNMEKLYLGRCAYGQVVALTEKDMSAGLDFVTKKAISNKEGLPNDTVGPYSTIAECAVMIHPRPHHPRHRQVFSDQESN